MLHTQRHCRTMAAVACTAGLLALVLPTPLTAQEPQQPAGDQLAPGKLRLDLKNSHLGYTNLSEAGIRYFVTQVQLTNLSDTPVSVPIADFQLTADGAVIAADAQFPRLTGYEFHVGGRSYRFRDLQRTDVLDIPPGEDRTAWVVFTGLDRTQDVPQLDLRLTFDGVEQHVDVNDHYEQLLRLEVERIGPQDSLALLWINGWLNSISAGTLVDTIDRVGASGITRIVIAFGEDARSLDQKLGSWLYQTAEGVRTTRTYAMFPAVVVPIRELHIAELPGRGDEASATHVHDSVASAVETALATAYRGLTPAEIATQIEQGHPLAQAAALVNSGADLSEAYLPLLLERAASEDPLLRRGAFIALSGSGNPQAVQTLADQAGEPDTRVAQLALECLAASRFATAHQALQQLLEGPLEIDDTSVVHILSRYPRPQWADYLVRMATVRKQSVSADVQRDVVLALGRIGHPRLPEILGEALQSPDRNLQQAAFGLLLNRPDAASEQLALSYALEQLAVAPPTPAMLQLFDRVREPHSASLLLQYLDDENLNKTQLINTLARIGPSGIDDELANRYETFDPGERAGVLSSLTHLRSPRLLPLARQGLESEHQQVFKAAVQALGMQSDAQTVEVLAGRLAEETEIGRVSTIAKALEEIGLPEAGRALDAARKTSSSDKRKVIARHYRSLQLRSPGGKYLQMAERHAQQNEHQKAINYYTIALKRDPDMSPAFSGRGHAYLKLDEYKQAEEDFRRAIKLDEDDGLAVAGLGITLAISGGIDEAVRIIEDASPRFEDDLLFAYNSACVYGRALERLAEQPKSDANQQQIREFQDAAISRLKASIDLGFPDLDWMGEDPDLASLRHLKDFQVLAGNQDDSDEPDGGKQDTNRRPPPPAITRPPQPGEQ